MEPLSEKIKYLYILFQRSIRKIFFVFPIRRNRVIFESFSGDGYSCSPKYISKRLHDKYGNELDIIWALKDPGIIDKGIKTCKYRSLQHFIYRITAKVYVCNFLQAIEIPKRKKQIEIQTWHGGGCYKKIGVEEKARGSIYAKRRDMHVRETDLFIASSLFWEEEVMKKQLRYNGDVLKIGMPRNDFLLELPNQDKIKEIRKRAGIELNSYVILYAPTWREGMDNFKALDYKRLEKVFEQRFGKKCQFVFRSHLYGKEHLDGILDLSDYPDMQELLYACDALITDYSSCMWDYCLTLKPCFLYVPDLARYVDQRGFDIDIYRWGFPVCVSNTDLENAILNFNDIDFKKKMKHHQAELGSYEKGNATEQVVEIIAKICGVEKLDSI